MVFGQLVMPVQCCAVLGHGGGGHRHDQLAKSTAFLRVFTMGSWIHDGFAVNTLP